MALGILWYHPHIIYAIFYLLKGDHSFILEQLYGLAGISSGPVPSRKTGIQEGPDFVAG